jgi:hypothetical protein
MARTRFEDLHVYCLSEDLADGIWNIVLQWDQFAKFTQVVKLKPIMEELSLRLNACLNSIHDIPDDRTS